MIDNAMLKKILPHYYGNPVRSLFMVAAIIMLTTLPMFNEFMVMPTVFSIMCILVLGLTAGVTNPLLYWDAWVNVLVACVGFVATTAYAVSAWNRNQESFFLTDVILSFIFMLAVYLSVKTLRSFVSLK